MKSCPLGCSKKVWKVCVNSQQMDVHTHDTLCWSAEPIVSPLQRAWSKFDLVVLRFSSCLHFICISLTFWPRDKWVKMAAAAAFLIMPFACSQRFFVNLVNKTFGHISQHFPLCDCIDEKDYEEEKKYLLLCPSRILGHKNANLHPFIYVFAEMLLLSHSVARKAVRVPRFFCDAKLHEVFW